MASLNFEDGLRRLDEIVKLLEKGDAPLEAALKLFEEGTTLVSKCNTLLDNAQQKVMTILKKDDTMTEVPFQGEAN